MKLGIKLKKIINRQQGTKKIEKGIIAYLERQMILHAKLCGDTSYAYSLDRESPQTDWEYIVNYFISENIDVYINDKKIYFEW